MLNTNILIKTYKLTLIVVVNFVVWLIPGLILGSNTPDLIATIWIVPTIYIGFVSSFILLVVGTYEIAKEKEILLK